MRIGFIGTGNMGSALIKGYLRGDPAAAASLSACDADPDKLGLLASETGIRACGSIAEVAGVSDAVVLAVKPNIYDTVLEELAGCLPPGRILISMAAGISLAYIGRFFSAPVKIIRIMPNTPALVNEGMTAVCHNDLVTDAELEAVKALFRSVGKTEDVLESQMDAVTGVSGSSPAYAYMFMEALAAAGVQHGLPEDQALRLAAQSTLGAAKMVMETGVHPNQLRDNVCSPGGTTIEAVRALQANGFREDVLEAVRAAVEKSIKMTK